MQHAAQQMLLGDSRVSISLAHVECRKHFGVIYTHIHTQTTSKIVFGKTGACIQINGACIINKSIQLPSLSLSTYCYSVILKLFLALMNVCLLKLIGLDIHLCSPSSCFIHWQSVENNYNCSRKKIGFLSYASNTRQPAIQSDEM